jgi:hypothetical protein
MEILIPGLILVALMVWASTKIKKRAADAFEAEFIEAETYSLQKPEGFLHVIGDEKHEFAAYSKEYGKNDNTGIRQATIELDVIPGADLTDECERIKSVTDGAEVTVGSVGEIKTCRIEGSETANDRAFHVVYKITEGQNAIYRLRIAVLREHADEYLRKIDETLDRFIVKMN